MYLIQWQILSLRKFSQRMLQLHNPFLDFDEWKEVYSSKFYKLWCVSFIWQYHIVLPSTVLMWSVLAYCKFWNHDVQGYELRVSYQLSYINAFGCLCIILCVVWIYRMNLTLLTFLGIVFRMVLPESFRKNTRCKFQFKRYAFSLYLAETICTLVEAFLIY